MQIIYGLIAFIASCIGAVSGIGGGVIIKPVLDSIGLMDVKTVSFLSGCTVLMMAFSSFIRNLKSETKINYSISIGLAVGASVGGYIGKLIFGGIGSYLAVLQAVLMLIVNLGVLIFVLNKLKITMLKISNPALCVVIGFLLGCISSFLGIGGGPLNIAVLTYFYSMPPKETARNSLFIILFSQITSLMTIVFSNTVPVFDWSTLIVMCLGGIFGAIAGSRISSAVNDAKVDLIFRFLLIGLIMLNIYNVLILIIG